MGVVEDSVCFVLAIPQARVTLVNTVSLIYLHKSFVIMIVTSEAMLPSGLFFPLLEYRGNVQLLPCRFNPPDTCGSPAHYIICFRQ